MSTDNPQLPEVVTNVAESLIDSVTEAFSSRSLESVTEVFSSRSISGGEVTLIVLVVVFGVVILIVCCFCCVAYRVDG